MDEKKKGRIEEACLEAELSPQDKGLLKCTLGIH